MIITGYLHCNEKVKSISEKLQENEAFGKWKHVSNRFKIDTVLWRITGVVCPGSNFLVHFLFNNWSKIPYLSRDIFTSKFYGAEPVTPWRAHTGKKIALTWLKYCRCGIESILKYLLLSRHQRSKICKFCGFGAVNPFLRNVWP